MASRLSALVTGAAKLAVTLLLVSMVVFLLLELIPGSVVDAVLPDGATAQDRLDLETRYGLNDPMVQRYLGWLGNVMTGDLGRSFKTNVPVAESILQRLPVTAGITILAIVLALAVAVPVAVYCAYRAGGLVDRITGVVVSVVLSTPPFLIALLLILGLAIGAGLFPTSGYVPVGRGIGPHLRSIALPVITLALVEAVGFIRILRGDVVTTLKQDFVLAARARGIPVASILIRHSLRPSAFSFTTVLGVSFARLIGGTVIIEMLFGLPGIGTLVVQAINGRDLVLVQGIVLVAALTYVAINALVDAAYPLLDPRVRTSS